MSAEGQEGGYVTNRDLFREVQRLAEHNQNLGGYMRSMLEAKDDHEVRLRKLERWEYAMPASMGMGIIALAGLVLQLFGHK